MSVDVLTPIFQTSLLQAMVQDHTFLAKARSIVTPALWKDAEERKICKAILSHYDKYKASPSKRSFPLVLMALGLDESSVKTATDVCYSELQDVGFVFDHLHDFVKKSRYRDTLIKGMEKLKVGDFDGIYQSFRELSQSLGSQDGTGEFFFDMARPVLESLDNKDIMIPTGFAALDEKLSGGAARGTQGVLLTPPNRGKTTALVNIGKYAVLQGLKVAHLTTELSAMVTARRYLMSMCRMSKAELKEKKRTAYNKILELAESIAKENLIIKRFPPGSCTTKDVRNWLDSIRNVHGFIPDVLIVDMALYLKSTKAYDEKRHELSAIYTDLRDIAVEYNVAEWTAHQTNRQGGSEEVIGIRDLAEDFGIAGITDVIVSVNQNNEEKRNGEARLFLAKARDDESLVTVSIAADWSRAWMGDLDG